MKIALVVIPFFLLSCTIATVSVPETEYVIDVYDSLVDSKNKLFLKANRWMVSTFNNAESVIQHSDKEEGVIVGKYLMFGQISSGAYGVTNDNRVYAIIDISVKDGKAKIEIKPQGTWQYDESGMTIYTYSKQDAINEMKGLSKSFLQALLKEESDF